MSIYFSYLQSLFVIFLSLLWLCLVILLKLFLYLNYYSFIFILFLLVLQFNNQVFWFFIHIINIDYIQIKHFDQFKTTELRFSWYFRVQIFISNVLWYFDNIMIPFISHNNQVVLFFEFELEIFNLSKILKYLLYISSINTMVSCYFIGVNLESFLD